MTGRRVQRTLEPSVLRWARERAGFDAGTVAAKVGVKPERVAEWERSGRISVAQADRLARHTRTPVGYLYLRRPPRDDLPIPDFRAAGGVRPRRPSPDLLATVHLMARRQSWMREELIEDGAAPLPFVGRCRDSTVAETAAAMREHLGLQAGWAQGERTWTDALRRLRERVEARGVLVVFNGVVGNDTHRGLDRGEFQGFTLIDDYAPLIFVNGADFKAAQMFTLAHELAHVFVGAAGVSNLDAARSPSHAAERFCNEAAAEFLVSREELIAHWKRTGTVADAFQAAARRFKVSTLVAARRTLDLGLVDRDEFLRFYDNYQQQAAQRGIDESTGGNFWNSQNVRIGRRFGAAVRRAVKEGRLSYREAYSLTGLRGDTFHRYVLSLDPAS